MVDYLIPKLLYICLYGVLGSAIPYLSLFYADKLQLPSQQIGIILAIAPFIQSIACPFWTIQADKRPSWHGRLMAILMFVGGLSIIGLMFIPMLLPPDVTSPDIILALTITLAVSFAFFGQPVAVLVDSAVLKILGENGIYYGDQRLWGSISNGICILLVGYLIEELGINSAFYIFGISVASFILIASFTKVDTTEDNEREPLLDPLKQQPANKGFYTMDPNSDNFQSNNNNVTDDNTVLDDSHRLSIATSHADTLMIESEQNTNYLNLSRTRTSIVARDVQDEASMLLDQQEESGGLPPLGLALSHIPTLDTSLAAIANIMEEHEMGVSLKSIVFGSIKVWTFLCMSLLFGVFYSMIAQFLFLFLKQDLELDSSVIGWTGPLGGVMEVSTFYVSRMLLEKFSVPILVTSAHIAIIARNLIYKTLTPNQPLTLTLALLSQLLNGFSYAMIWSTCVSEVDQMFPANQRAIAQGILAALFSGLGFGLGCILGGYAYDHYGAQMLFDISISIAVLSLIVFWFGRLWGNIRTTH